jgi:formate dehydrogenase iron-sulfur subunit
VDITIVRNGSRGLFWLEPLVEVDTAEGRMAFGPIEPDEAASLFDANFLKGGAHPKAQGRPEEIPYLKHQQRMIFARCGVIAPLSIDDYRSHGGLKGLSRAIEIGPASIVDEVLVSGLRGRGGAGFPTGIKWRTVAGVQADQKYIVCNADEGDSGTFADRMLMEGDPFTLIEGMAIAAIAVGATKGFVYIRSEYPHAFATFAAAIAKARAAGVLGPRVLGSDHAFDIEARLGAGAYICGEETSLLESLEGRRGQVRAKPPLPAIQGLFGKPTVINNVLSFASAPWILEHGGKAYAEYGMGRSRGTQPFQLAGNIRRGGLVELALGVTIRRLVDEFGGGTKSGRKFRAVQVGGPLGAYFPDRLLDTPLDYEAMLAAKGMLGHGGIVVFDDSVDLARQARFAFEFCAKESCGKCTPCRIGSTRGVETVDKIVAGVNRDANIELLRDLCTVLADGSLCALGGLTPFPVLSALDNFSEDFAPAPASVAAE